MTKDRRGPPLASCGSVQVALPTSGHEAGTDIVCPQVSHSKRNLRIGSRPICCSVCTRGAGKRVWQTGHSDGATAGPSSSGPVAPAASVDSVTIYALSRANTVSIHACMHDVAVSVLAQRRFPWVYCGVLACALITGQVVAERGRGPRFRPRDCAVGFNETCPATTPQTTMPPVRGADDLVRPTPTASLSRLPWRSSATGVGQGSQWMA